MLQCTVLDSLRSAFEQQSVRDAKCKVQSEQSVRDALALAGCERCKVQSRAQSVRDAGHGPAIRRSALSALARHLRSVLGMPVVSKFDEFWEIFQKGMGSNFQSN